jgi:hypothetical protein
MCCFLIDELSDSGSRKTGAVRHISATEIQLMKPDVAVATDLHVCRFCEVDQPGNHVASVVPLIYEAATELL